MALTEAAKGTPTVGALADLVPTQTVLQHYATWIFFQNLTITEEYEIVVYVNDPNPTTAERIYDTFTVSGAQSDPAVFIPFIPTDSYRVTAEKISGTDRVIDWVLYTSS